MFNFGAFSDLGCARPMSIWQQNHFFGKQLESLRKKLASLQLTGNFSSRTVCANRTHCCNLMLTVNQGLWKSVTLQWYDYYYSIDVIWHIGAGTRSRHAGSKGHTLPCVSDSSWRSNSCGSLDRWATISRHCVCAYWAQLADLLCIFQCKPSMCRVWCRST